MFPYLDKYYPYPCKLIALKLSISANNNNMQVKKTATFRVQQNYYD